jgi:hypothetical protein
MSCRSNPGSSAITSYARATSGLADVQTQNLYHRLVGEGRVLQTQPPSGQELAAWMREVTAQVQADSSIGEVQRQRILNRLANLGEYTPDGPTFYAWQHIWRLAQEGQAALDQTYGLLGTAGSLTPEQRAARVQELTVQFDRGEVARNWQPPADLLARLGEWQSYQMGNRPFYGTSSLPQDRRTQYILATLATDPGVWAGNAPPSPRETAQETPAVAQAALTRCQSCGQFIGEGNHHCQTVLAVNEETEPSNLPPPDPVRVWSELYQAMPETDPDNMNAPGSTYRFNPVTTPLNTRQGEVASFNELNSENWRTDRLQSLSPMGADRLYDYQRRRLRFQADRLNGQYNYLMAVRGGTAAQVEWAYQQLAEGMREYQKRRLQLNQMQRQRQAVGYPIGSDPDENGEGISADYALNQWLSSRSDIPQASGQGLVWNNPEPEPHFDLPNYPPPSPEQAEPLYFRVREGQGEGLRRSVTQSGLPVIVVDANTPIPAGALVLNWGDYEWEETGQYAVINSAEAVSVARDKLSSLERLGELAPASTTRPAEAVARFGPVFAGKGRTGQSGSGKAILQNPPGGPTDRPLGNLSASAVSGYDYYQEYLPQRTEYRALVLGGEVIALYKRVPQGVEPGQLRPDNFEYQPLTQIGQRQLEASQLAMERIGLDFGGVDLVEDTSTGRLLVLEVNSAPGLGQESLERLYRAAHAQLQNPEAEAE